MVGCSTYLRDKVGDILDVSAPAGDFMLTPLPLDRAGAGITTVLCSQSTVRRHCHGDK
jgi:ferredoxin-NADP reductase